MTSELLDQLDTPLDNFYGDGAYDKKKCRKAIHQRGGQIIVPPPKNAVVHENEPAELTSRNRDVERIEQIGRAEWKVETGYHKRSLSEVAMYRYKGSIGNTLRARKFENQMTEAKIGCHILNFFKEYHKLFLETF